jgi:hypothetical protein
MGERRYRDVSTRLMFRNAPAPQLRAGSEKESAPRFDGEEHREEEPHVGCVAHPEARRVPRIRRDAEGEAAEAAAVVRFNLSNEQRGPLVIHERA